MHKLPNKLTCIVHLPMQGAPGVPASSIQIEKPHRAPYGPIRQDPKYQNVEREQAVHSSHCSPRERATSGPAWDDELGACNLAPCSNNSALVFFFSDALVHTTRCAPHPARPVWLADSLPWPAAGVAAARSVKKENLSLPPKREERGRIVDGCENQRLSSYHALLLPTVGQLDSARTPAHDDRGHDQCLAHLAKPFYIAQRVASIPSLQGQSVRRYVMRNDRAPPYPCPPGRETH